MFGVQQAPGVDEPQHGHALAFEIRPRARPNVLAPDELFQELALQHFLFLSQHMNDWLRRFGDTFLQECPHQLDCNRI